MATKSRHDFRKTKIYPTSDDITGKNVANLSPNLIEQSYESSEQYFETQFELLREESVRPLVEAANKLKEILSAHNEKFSGNDTEDHNTKEDRKKKLRETIDKEVECNVYFDIRLTEPLIDYDINYGTVLKFTFDYKPLENIDLVDCQHLMNGGILCISSDNFQKSIIFGIIVKSQLREFDSESNERLWNFCLKLDFDNKMSKNFNQLLLRPKTTFIGLESPSFYEGFRYTLQTLKDMSENFPMNRYITGIPKDIKQPQYLNEETVYDLSCIKLKKSEVNGVQSGRQLSPLSSVRLLESDVFGDKRTYSRQTAHLKDCSTFDTKQFDAFYAALTKEFCIIEGPPGTGKTFVGLKIVECLLNNSKAWNQSSEVRPLLIVCYKNHALDQFLEGIIKFNKNVVRIGGSSESKELEEYKLGRIETKFHEDLERQNQFKSLTAEELNQKSIDCNILDPKLVAQNRKLKRIRRRFFAIHNSMFEIIQKIESSFREIVELEEIESFIKPKSLAQYFASRSDPLYNWLNAENNPNFLNVCQKQLNKKLSVEAFDEISFLEKKNVLEMESREKWTLYLYWRQQLLQKCEKMLRDGHKQMAAEIEKIKHKKIKFQRMLCKSAQVIGLTVTGATKYKELVKAFNPKIMIVEEAAEVLEGHVVAALSPSIEHLILIGDHKQLRPLTNVQQLTDEYKLDVSLFERMVINKLPFVQLELQHRMKPCISQLLKVGDIYDNLRNGEKVKNYPNIDFTFGKDIYFIDHQHIEDNNFCRDVPDKSRSNLHEAKLVVELVKYFILRKYPEDKITVLTTYNAQLSLIRRLMLEQKSIFVRQVEDDKNPLNIVAKDNKTKKPEEELKVRVSSVDGFQGEENNIIIISFVRSSKRNAIGFLGNKNRVNVALSRAKHALYCVGNFTIMAREEKTQMWSQIVEYLAKNESFGEEFTIGCKCTGGQSISMPGQLELLNLQIKNGRCKCPLK